MNIQQVTQVYKNKKAVPCPITERLVKAGYQQQSKGYIAYAKDNGIEVNYKKGEPNQWWHLIESCCNNSIPQKTFGRNIVCGELILWMAEVIDCVSKKELNLLVDKIIQSGIPKKRISESRPNIRYERKKWNKEIQDLCFDKIVKAVENLVNV